MAEYSKLMPRLRIIPLTLMLIGALAVLKLSETAQGLPGFSVSGANASMLFPARTKNASQPMLSTDTPVQTEPVASPRVREKSSDETRVLERLRERRAALDFRAAALDTRETLIRTAETALSDQLAQLAARETALAAREAALQTQNDADIDAIVSAYERMKPRDAARVFDILEDELLVNVANGMRSQALAGVLAEMTPDRARQLTTLLAERRAPPVTDGQDRG